VFIAIDPHGSPTLHEAADLKRLAITGPRPDAAAVARLAEAGVALTDDRAHGFVAPATVVHWASAGSLPEGWQVDFDAMVAYATSKGWTDDAGRLRAHTEWTE
jgi:hypothetical protein